MLGKVASLWRMSPFYRIRFWPCLATLVLTIVFLQVLHITLLSRLEVKEARMKQKALVSRPMNGRVFKDVVQEMEDRVKNSYRFDKSGTYHVLDNFLTSEHVILGQSEFDISIVTHSSSSQLHNLIDLSRRWNGPISISVFTHDADFVTTISSILHLHFCYAHIKHHASFHLVYPIRRAPKNFENLSNMRLSCLERKITDHVTDSPNPGSNYANTDLEYPNNLLRNMAINYAQTRYIFMIDMDILPSANLRTEFQKFMSTTYPHISSLSKTLTNDSYLSSHRSLSAFVVPVFEVRELVKIPESKAELLQQWDLSLIRPFYWKMCQKCQGHTDYERWMNLGKGGPIRVGYSLEREGIWEPFYIAKTSLPLYDERFKQYGYNRISQVCEMHVAGFTFNVLDNAFVVHKGFKVKDGFHDLKNEENARNRQLFVKFKEELKVKYPSSDRSC